MVYHVGVRNVTFSDSWDDLFELNFSDNAVSVILGCFLRALVDGWAVSLTGICLKFRAQNECEYRGYCNEDYGRDG